MNFRKRGIPQMLLAAVLCLLLLAGCAAEVTEPPLPSQPEASTEWNTSSEVSTEASTESVSEEEPSCPETESEEDNSLTQSVPVLPQPAPTPAPDDLPQEEPDLPQEPPMDPVPSYYTLRLVITDMEGNPIPEAYVTAGEICGTADEEGVFTFHTMEKNFRLYVTADGFVSFCEYVELMRSETTAAISMEKASALRELLNDAVLRPYTFHNDDLNKTIDGLFATLFTPEMDTYDKVKACYDWLVLNVVYKRPGHEGSGHWDCAVQVFRDHKGTCDCYSSAFAAMMRRLGLESYVVEGITSANAGGMTGHVWTIMVLDGKTYIFDPQVEDAIANRTSDKEIYYVRFGLAEPNGKYKYNGRSRARQMEKFDRFLAENGYFAY